MTTDADFLLEHGPRLLHALRAFALRVGQRPLVARQLRKGVRHVCSGACRMWEEPAPASGPASYVYICAESGHVHLCTRLLCRFTADVVSQDEDGLCVQRVCRLTHVVYPAEFEVESVLTRVSHVPEPESEHQRLGHAAVHRLTHETNVEAEDLRQRPASAVVTKPVAQKRKAPAVSHGTDNQAVAKRLEVVTGPLQQLLSVLPPELATRLYRPVCAQVERVWHLLQSATNFDAQSGKMRPQLLAVVITYFMREGLAVPVDGRDVMVIQCHPDLRRLPDMRHNGVVSMARCTVAQKAFLRCLNALPKATLLQWHTRYAH